jgi:hypothetical protein
MQSACFGIMELDRKKKQFEVFEIWLPHTQQQQRAFTTRDVEKSIDFIG